MNFRVNRRDFFRFAGGGALGLAASGVTLRGISTVTATLAADEVQVPRGPEGHALSVCSLCPGGCGLRVRTIGKRAVKIEGNPLHPINHGRLCPRGLAGLQVLYHPDRLRAPQKNVGSRQAPEWKEISWDEALGTVAERLGERARRGEAHTVVFVAGRTGHLQQRLLRRFLAAYGSLNYFQAPSGLDSAQLAVYLQQGISEGVAYDLEGTRYLLSFGANLLEGWGSPVSTMRAFGHWRDAAGGRRTKFVQIEPRFSVTAARADEWVPLRPGMEAALALGIAYVLITEGLYDARFVSEHTFGFEDWRDARGQPHQGFRSLVLTEYRLNQVAALTEVPVETILRLAREFGRNRPGLAVGPHPASTLPGDLYAALAVHSLNALMGSLEVPGGALVRPPLPGEEEPPAAGKALPPSLVGTEESPGLRPDLARLPQAILARKPYPVQAVLIHGTDPVFSLPNGDEFAAALQQVPFVVSFAPFLDETAACADLILPDHTDLEKWQEVASPPTVPAPLLSLSAPVVEPVHSTRATADVVLELAHRLGGRLAAALPHASFEDFLRAQAEALYAAQAGYTFATTMEETWNRLLERSGWWAPTYSTSEELWAQMKERGGWWEPTYYYGEFERVFQTPSRRFEFYSQRLTRWAERHPERAQAAGLKPGDDRLALPHQPPLPEAPAGFPLVLIPVEVLPLAGSDGAHLPYLQQIAGSYAFENWDSWLEMNPATAAALSLERGEPVWVESRRSKVRVRLRLHAAVRPGVVHLPLGYGRTQGSDWACRGVNPLQVVETQPDPVSGWLAAGRTYVRVYRG